MGLQTSCPFIDAPAGTNDMLTAIERIVNDEAWFAARRRSQSGTKDGCGHAFRDESWRTFGSNEFSESIESNEHQKLRNPMFRAIKRLFIWMGLMAEKATETDAINEAEVERDIRDPKAKADKAHYANGQLAWQIALLKDQIKRQDRQREELQSLLQAAAPADH